MAMGREKIVVLLSFVLAISACVAFRHMDAQTQVAATAIGGEPQKPSSAGEFRGVSVQLTHSDPNHPYEQILDEIAQTGANSVCMVVAAYQENATSSTIFVDARRTPTDTKMLKLFEYAHSKGLRVLVMPIVLLENPREGEWRGKINPESWDHWWEHYTNYVLHFAGLCQQGNVEVFMVGSELISVETQEDRWRSLIKQVRGVFKHDKGRLTYSANWDHYKIIRWWNDLDMVGMTTYYDLSGGKKPTLPLLLESWTPIKQEIMEWQEKVNRPILFTEVGWPNQVTCAQYPWDYYRSPDKPDPAAQKLCFESFFKTWGEEKNIAGILVWEWRTSPSQNIGEKDTSYVPAGKPAMQVIREFFARPSGNTVQSPASAPAAAMAPANKSPEPENNATRQ